MKDSAKPKDPKEIKEKELLLGGAKKDDKRPAAAAAAEKAAPEPEKNDEEIDVDVELNLGELDITSEEYSFDDVGGHIQENLEDEVVKQALEQGLDLRIYSRQIEAELLQVERASVDDYITEAKNLANLHHQIKNSDAILQNMEQMLRVFQADLGTISEEIHTLQEQSVSMNLKVKNRKALQAPLSQFVASLIIAPELVDVIAQSNVGDAFMHAVEQLAAKLEHAASQPPETRAINDVAADLDRLRLKAASKIREYVLGKIQAARKPLSNPQVQQQALLKTRRCFDFVLKHCRSVAEEIRDEYIDTMGKVHATYFKNYIARLMKLQYEDAPDKDDLLASDDQMVKKGGIFPFASKQTLKNRSTIFTLGDRAKVLEEISAPILVPHAKEEKSTPSVTNPKAPAEPQKLPYEQLFRSLQYALMDNSAREYLFCMEFFNLRDAKGYEFFKAVMGKSMTMVLKQLESYVVTTYDAISLTLCARINSKMQQMMREKAILCLQPYFEAIDQLIWPRFSFILNLHTESVRSTDVEKMTSIDTRPHFIVRRYAEYSAALLGLNEGVNYPPVIDALMALQQEVENFILRLAAEFPNQRDHLIFLINNYDMLLTVYSERTTISSEEAKNAQKALETRIKEFVEVVLSPFFGGLIGFVKETENALEKFKGREQDIPVDEKKVQALISSFFKEWKKGIDKISEDVMRSFTNFKNGTAILQEVLTQLVVYYGKFSTMLKQTPYKRASGWPDLVDKHILMVEIKKHKTSFN